MKKLNIPRFRRKHVVIGILAAALLLAVGTNGVSAKYVKDLGEHDGVVRAKEFYFSSDLLEQGGTNHILNPGTTSIEITLRNHDDQLRYTEDTIDYSVTTSGGYLSHKDTPETTVIKLTGELSGTGNQSTSKILLSNLQPGQSYTVTATGTAGYEKTLTATFTVKAENPGVYKYLESDPSGAFVLLTVWTECSKGNVSITFPSGLIPDATNPNLAKIYNYNTETGKYSGVTAAQVGSLNEYSSHTYRFFLETPFTEYTANQFTVTVGEDVADFAIPE